MKLEEYIRQHKSAFEEEVPDTAWLKVQRQLPRRPSPWPAYLRYAAALLVFVGVGYMIGLRSNSVGQAGMDTQDAALVAYSSKIDQKKAKLHHLVSNSPELQATFNQDLAELQNDFEYLRGQLTSNPNRDAILDAMIQNLEWQIELLNQQTKIAEKKTQSLM